MIKLVSHFRFAALGIVIAALAAPSALAASDCSQMARTIKSGQASAKAMAADRDELLLEVEAAGDAWEDQEALRNFSASHAAEADAARAEYEALKAELVSLEDDLQARLSRLNRDAANYNRTCATRRR
ncbi:hypothetical protein [Henriciella litoralis]|uniref:hypothetical protein n=1 Tax=Henriciella litoralis TaxID=568102 RepID=UPI000A01DAC8|nr:hypothetical protein [Henriciella litoralis]